MKKTFTIIFFSLSVLLFGQSNTVDSLMESSKQKADLKNYSAAINDLNIAILLDNKNPKPYCLRGMIYAAGYNNYKSAYSDFDSAIVHKPDEGELYILRARTARLLNNFKQSYNDLKKAFELMPDNGYEYYSASYIIDTLNVSLSRINEKAYTETNKSLHKYFSNHDYRNTIIKLTNVIKKYPDYYLAYAFRGFAYHLSEMANEAIADYKKAIELNCYCDLALYLLAGMQIYYQEQYTDGIESLSKVIKYKPEKAEAYTCLGDALYKTGQTKLACDTLKYAEKLGDINATKSIIKYCK